MFPIILLLFTLVPALEFYILFSIGSEIGALNSFAIIILTGVIGAALAKSQGMAILAQIQHKISKGEMPGPQIIQGFLIFGGGLLLLTPGFLTDLLGFSMVIPGSRHFIIILLEKYLKNTINTGNFQFKSFNGHRDSENKNHKAEHDTFEAEFKKSDFIE